MKRKYKGLTSICMVLAALIASVIYALTISWGSGSEPQVVRRAPDNSVNIPSPDAVKEMMRASMTLADLANPSGRDAVPSDLSLFGRQPVQSGPAGFNHSYSHATANRSVGHSVSLAFSSGRKKFCIVDGTFYKEQSDLPQGGKILKIESTRILVDKNGVHKWISVDGSSVEDSSGRKKRTLAQNRKNDALTP